MRISGYIKISIHIAKYGDIKITRPGREENILDPRFHPSLFFGAETATKGAPIFVGSSSGQV